MGNNRLPFVPDTFYHLYNHGNGDDNIFRNDENYNYFLKRYTYYINPIADTFAFCLMPNHFHFLVRLKKIEDILIANPQGFQNLVGLTVGSYDKKMSQQFSNFLNSYSKSYNKRYDRKGSLFLDNIKRKKVDNAAYFNRLVHYIHANPVLHGFVRDMHEWKYSSYHALFSNKFTYLKREELLHRFGGRDQYLRFHEMPLDKRIVLEFEF
jgi:putative transposase